MEVKEIDSIFQLSYASIVLTSRHVCVGVCCASFACEWIRKKLIKVRLKAAARNISTAIQRSLLLLNVCIGGSGRLQETTPVVSMVDFNAIRLLKHLNSISESEVDRLEIFQWGLEGNLHRNWHSTPFESRPWLNNSPSKCLKKTVFLISTECDFLQQSGRMNCELTSSWILSQSACSLQPMNIAIKISFLGSMLNIYLFAQATRWGGSGDEIYCCNFSRYFTPHDHLKAH